MFCAGRGGGSLHFLKLIGSKIYPGTAVLLKRGLASLLHITLCFVLEMIPSGDRGWVGKEKLSGMLRSQLLHHIFYVWLFVIWYGLCKIQLMFGLHSKEASMTRFLIFKLQKVII